MSFLKKRSRNHESFLIINPFGIGDVLFSTPLIRNLAENFPRARIYYLANRKTGPLLANHPLIKRVFVYERDEFTEQTKTSLWLGFKKYACFISEIRKEKIDTAIDLSLNTPYGFFAWAAGIKKRFGLEYKNRGIFLTRKLKIEGFCDKHVSEYYLDVLKLMGIQSHSCGMEVYVDRYSRDWTEEFLKKKEIEKNALIIGIAPCGGDAFGKDACIKRWPSNKFSLLIDRLMTELNAKIFIFAGPKEKIDVEVILEKASFRGNVYEFTGSSLSQTVALVDKCSLFIGNDTGPMRFADALNKKIVALFGPVDEKVYGPYPYAPDRTIVLKKDMACRPCYRKFRLAECRNNKKCLEDITVEEVFQSVRELLGKGKNKL